MKPIKTTLSAVVVAALAAGCASAPTASPSSQPAATNVGTPPAAQPVSLATTATAPATVEGDAKHQELVKNARTMGYKPRKEKDGTTRWCKTEATTGSRFETTSCVSEDTLAMQVEQMLQTQDYMRSVSGQCNGAACGSH